MSKTSRKIGKGVLGSFGSLVTLVGAAAAGWIVYSRKFISHEQQLEKAIDAEQNDIENDDISRVSYYADTSGKGIPLVLLHSINAASSAFEMKPIFERFRGERPVYAVELPGFGFSDRSERLYDPQLYQRTITTFLAEVVGQSADVVSLSLSSEFAALAAVKDSQYMRSLVMISPTGFDLPKTDWITEVAEKSGSKSTLYSGLAVPLWNRPLFDLISSRPSIQFFLNKSFEGLVPERFVDYAYYSAHQPGAAYAPTYFLSGKLFTSSIRESVYKNLDFPVLVIYDHDPYTNFEMLPMMLQEKENWQGVRISPTKGLPHWEQPEKTFEAMTSFWADI